MPATTLSIPSRYRPSRRVLELSAVGITAATHLLLTAQPQAHLVFVVGAVLGWGGYLATAAIRSPEKLKEWGFSREGLWETAAMASPIAIAVAIALTAWGRLAGAEFDLWMLLPLALYPVWGVIQQFLVQGLLVKNLDDAGVPTIATVAVAAAAFGLVHWPYPVLMMATVGLGLVFTPLYLKFRNLWVLGFLHGWLGTLLYQFVLQRHPIHEALGLG